MSNAVAVKKTILFLGKPEGDIEQIKKSLAETSNAKLNPSFIFAKDGPDAAMKAQNQKFDAVVVDANSPRLREGGFLEGLRRHKNTSQSGLIVLVAQNEPLALQDIDVDHVLEKPCTVDALVRALAKALVDIQKEETSSAPAPNSFAVDVRVLNALVKATCFICQQFGIEGIQLKKPQTKAIDVPWKGDIGASIAIQSRSFQGALVISFDQSVYLKMYETMLGEAQTVLNEENSEAIGEISNMILGNAKSDFTQYDVAMTIPTILKKGQNPPAPAGSAALCIPVETPVGQFYIEVIAHRLTDAK